MDRRRLPTAKKAHENAFWMLRTLFNNLPEFGSKAAANNFLAEHWENKDETKIDMLAESCEQQLAAAIKHGGRQQCKRQRRSRHYALKLIRSSRQPLASIRQLCGRWCPMSASAFEAPEFWIA